MAERWQTIPGFPAYEASDEGRIRRALPGPGTYPGKLLTTATDAEGYTFVAFGKKVKRVHRLVGEAFFGPLARGAEVHHRDEDRSNPRLSNLEVLPSKLAHKERHRRVDAGLRRHGERNPSISCACGCGRKFRKYDNRGRPRRYVYGHNVVLRAAAA